MKQTLDVVDQRLAVQLKALAHPARLRILDVLAARGTCNCGELVADLPLAQATVSQHLKVLKDTGLLQGTIDGPRSCYCLDPDAIAALRRALDARLARLTATCCQPEPEDRAVTAIPDIKAIVRDKYGAIATSAGKTGCCGPSCCAEGSLDIVGDAYAGTEGYVPEADLGLGCGLPTRHAGLRAGQTVVDLGSGAGLDAFVARQHVGETGRVIGVDMTAAMIERARSNAAKLGYANVEFRQGDIEDLPVEDGVADVVISNCVLNLVPDKTRVFAETFRVLKPGGHFCISDIVASWPLPQAIQDAAALYVGCIAGAVPEAHYLAVIRDTGFADVRIVERKTIALPDELLREHLSEAELRAFRASGVDILSVTVRGTKPSAG